jgi:hypothetical protein
MPLTPRIDVPDDDPAERVLPFGRTRGERFGFLHPEPTGGPHEAAELESAAQVAVLDVLVEGVEIAADPRLEHALHLPLGSAEIVNRKAEGDSLGADPDEQVTVVEATESLIPVECGEVRLHRGHVHRSRIRGVRRRARRAVHLAVVSVEIRAESKNLVEFAHRSVQLLEELIERDSDVLEKVVLVLREPLQRVALAKFAKESE